MSGIISCIQAHASSCFLSCHCNYCTVHTRGAGAWGRRGSLLGSQRDGSATGCNGSPNNPVVRTSIGCDGDAVVAVVELGAAGSLSCSTTEAQICPPAIAVLRGSVP